MSVALMSRVWALQGLGPSLKLVLLSMADYADDDGGRCYPSISTIAKRCGLSPAQARRHVHRLVDLGLVEVKANEKGGRPGQTAVYRLHIPAETACMDATPRTGASRVGNLSTRLAPMHETACMDARRRLAPVQADPPMNHHEPSGPSDVDKSAPPPAELNAVLTGEPGKATAHERAVVLLDTLKARVRYRRAPGMAG